MIWRFLGIIPSRPHPPTDLRKLLSRLSSQNLKSGQSLGFAIKNFENTMLSDVRCMAIASMSRTIGSTDRDRSPGSIVGQIERGRKIDVIARALGA